MKTTCFDHLVSIQAERGAAFVVLLDPDKLPLPEIESRVALCEEASADAFFVGGSLVHSADTDVFVRQVQAFTKLPVIGFPGSVAQISASLDAVLYLSVVSGRNPDFLFGRHVYVAPLIRRLGLEAIPTAYMLVESGTLTTAQYMSHSLPLPRSKPEIAAATALAAEMMGMRLLFLDCGSGADESVPIDMIESVRATCESPIVVGGGLRTSRSISDRVVAGASVIVVGNTFEQAVNGSYIQDLADAAHHMESKPL